MLANVMVQRQPTCDAVGDRPQRRSSHKWPIHVLSVGVTPDPQPFKIKVTAEPIYPADREPKNVSAGIGESYGKATRARPQRSQAE
jgi:hypothetical protein